MSDFQYHLDGSTLDEIAASAHACELQRSLEALATNDAGDNFGGFKRVTRSPKKSIVILPAPAVAPPGSTKICKGKLSVGGQKISVEAFRLA